ncbi:MAG: DUF3658 domain-containing protein [Campylobacterota bacterium]|nr:DUF3658 domain-containing protein [Campylobacterota bacterium]
MSIDEEINTLVEDALEKIDLTIQKILSSRENMDLYPIGTIGRAGGLLREFQKPILERHPELRPPPPKDYIQDPQMTEEQREFTDLLTSEKLEEIDKALLSNAKKNYLKVARLVSDMLMNEDIHIEGIPAVFYSERLRLLVENGFLESQGDLHYMRFSEVRLAEERN